MAFPSCKSWRLQYPSARQNMPTGTIVTWRFQSDSGVRSTGGNTCTYWSRVCDCIWREAVKLHIKFYLLSITCVICSYLPPNQKEKAELELENNQHYILLHAFLFSISWIPAFSAHSFPNIYPFLWFWVLFFFFSFGIYVHVFKAYECRKW